MRKSPYRKNAGNVWAAGLGLLGLLVTITIIVILVNIQTRLTKLTGDSPGEGDKDVETEFKAGKGPGEFLKGVKSQVEGINQQHIDDVNRAIRQEGGTPAPAPSTTPAPAPSPAPSPAPAAPAPSGGGPSGGEVIGPPSPISPIAPVQEGPGPNLRGATRPAGGINDAVNERNKLLEDAINGK